MTVVALCMEIGAFGDSFAGDLAAALGVGLLDLQPFDLSIAELHAFAASRPCALEPATAAVDELSARLAEMTLRAATAGDVLIVGWHAATVLASLSSVTRVCVRGPQPRGAWRGVRRFGYDPAGVAPEPAEGSQSLLSRFMRHVSGPRSRAPDEFDLVVDAGRLSAPDCRREIVEHVAHRARVARKAIRAELAQLNAMLADARATQRDLPSLRGCAVSVGGDDVGLAGIDSQSAAIALVEQYLHGSHEASPPADPLCRKALD
jgi:hypothetical protein